MGLSINEIQYTGGSRVFTFNFALGYLKRSDVSVYIQGELDGEGNQLYRSFTWNSDSEIEVTDPITATALDPAVVVIQRTVEKDTLVVDFNNEGSATRRNLMFGITQAMMAMHEFIDGRIEPLEEVYPFSEYLERMLEYLNDSLQAKDDVSALKTTTQGYATATAQDRAAIEALLGDLQTFDPKTAYTDARDTG